MKSREIDVSVLCICILCLPRKSLFPRGPSDEESGGFAAKPLASVNHDESNFANEILGIIE